MRLTLLGGYLGAGKTTWLRHALHGAARPPHVIVNEAAGLSVDDLMLRGAAGLTVLAGGCACCTGRAALTLCLRGLSDAHSRGEGPTEIVMETSGLADPGAILALIRDDPVLAAHVRVAETVVLVDALHGLAQLAADPLGQAQVAVADRLVVTKTDRADPVALARLLATLRAVNPLALVGAAELGLPVALPDLPPQPPLSLPDPAGARAPITAEVLDLPAPVDWAGLGLWLSALLRARGDDIQRVKGVVRTPAGRLLIQTVRRVVQPPEVLPDSPADGDDRLVFLGQGAPAAALARSLHRFLG